MTVNGLLRYFKSNDIKISGADLESGDYDDQIESDNAFDAVKKYLKGIVAKEKILLDGHEDAEDDAIVDLLDIDNVLPISEFKKKFPQGFEHYGNEMHGFSFFMLLSVDYNRGGDDNEIIIALMTDKRFSEFLEGNY